jgi:methylamine---glutamate N-methyltransferase subunit C
MTGLHADAFPEQQIRARARHGTAEVFPPVAEYGAALFGAAGPGAQPADELDQARLVPPVFMPERLAKLIDLGREPGHDDVDLSTVIGGFRSSLPVFLSALGSTRLASGDRGIAASRQAARLGLPMVIGENMVPVHGYRSRTAGAAESAILARIRAYAQDLAPGAGGIAVQQSTEDADSEVWNLLYSDPSLSPLVDSGRLAFELKIGQGAKPGLGGMTVVDEAETDRLAGQFSVHDVLGAEGGRRLRCATPGSFTEEIVRHQIRFMRNNFPRAQVWVKFHPGRDIARAAAVAWEAGAHAVTVDGAEGGTGWAPQVFLNQVGLPLAECLRRIGPPAGCLLATGRMWEGARAVKALALGATAVGLGRAALIAADEDAEDGLTRLVAALALEMRLLVSALGQYSPAGLSPQDLWWPHDASRSGQPGSQYDAADDHRAARPAAAAAAGELVPAARGVTP